MNLGLAALPWTTPKACPSKKEKAGSLFYQVCMGAIVFRKA
jgi:hypothetical protein